MIIRLRCSSKSHTRFRYTFNTTSFLSLFISSQSLRSALLFTKVEILLAKQVEILLAVTGVIEDEEVPGATSKGVDFQFSLVTDFQGWKGRWSEFRSFSCTASSPKPQFSDFIFSVWRTCKGVLMSGPSGIRGLSDLYNGRTVPSQYYSRRHSSLA